MNEQCLFCMSFINYIQFCIQFQIYDKYADRNGTFWQLCTLNTKIDSNSIKQTSTPAIFITSYLNTIHIRQYSNKNQLGILNATVRVQSGKLIVFA